MKRNPYLESEMQRSATDMFFHVDYFTHLFQSTSYNYQP